MSDLRTCTSRQPQEMDGVKPDKIKRKDKSIWPSRSPFEEIIYGSSYDDSVTSVHPLGIVFLSFHVCGCCLDQSSRLLLGVDFAIMTRILSGLKQRELSSTSAG